MYFRILHINIVLCMYSRTTLWDNSTNKVNIVFKDLLLSSLLSHFFRGDFKERCSTVILNTVEPFLQETSLSQTFFVSRPCFIGKVLVHLYRNKRLMRDWLWSLERVILVKMYEAMLLKTWSWKKAVIDEQVEFILKGYFPKLKM